LAARVVVLQISDIPEHLVEIGLFDFDAVLKLDHENCTVFQDD